MEKQGFGRIAGPSLATAVMLALLVWLGVWQLHRRAWKAALLADIDRGEQAAPVPLGSAAPAPFTKVSVTGVLSGSFALYGSEVRDEVPEARIGAQLLEVLQRTGQPPVLVDLGWVPADEHDAVCPLTGTVTLAGYVRAPDRPGWLSAADDEARRHFYTLDPKRIGAALGAPGVAPFTVIALGQASGGKPVAAGAPAPAEALPRPPSNHLQYALTWFGLAGTLLCVYGVWVRGSVFVPRNDAM